ncbi:hypothetical protein [Streptomyces sp. CB01881]|uniref:hypothetical protein n=1 Tax=Streptomyces sp. CB01881 TaxID=2078691 RepID=UPI0023F7CEB1|nr:hypothetical protein [Streptomyces sp. CB01881]
MLGLLREGLPGEARVALVPRSVHEVADLGLTVVAEAGAGAAAGFPDAAYRAAGARVVRTREAASADLVVSVRRPTVDTLGPLRHGRILVGLLRPMDAPFVIRRWADEGATLISLDQLPAAAASASPLDAASAQAGIAGYKAVVVAADRLGRELADHFTGPAQVLVLGGGPAGVRAVETARSLGAAVYAQGGDARARAALTAAGAQLVKARERLDARAQLVDAGGRPGDAGGPGRSWVFPALPPVDVVISTSEPVDADRPALIGDDALRTLRPGSVVVDLACGPYGRTIAAAEPGIERVTGNGVIVIGAGDLAARVPVTASAAFSDSVTALLSHLVHEGVPVVDLAEPALAELVVSHAGTIRHEGVLRRLAAMTAAAGLP